MNDNGMASPHCWRLPGADKDVNAVINTAGKVGLARKVVSLKPVVFVKI